MLLIGTCGGFATLTGGASLAVPQAVGPIYRLVKDIKVSVSVDFILLLSFDEVESLMDESLPIRYDAMKIKQYWDRRPMQVLGRATEIMLKLGPFFSKLLFWECLIRRKILSHEGDDDPELLRGKSFHFLFLQAFSRGTR